MGGFENEAYGRGRAPRALGRLLPSEPLSPSRKQRVLALPESWRGLSDRKKRGRPAAVLGHGASLPPGAPHMSLRCGALGLFCPPPSPQMTRTVQTANQSTDRAPGNVPTSLGLSVSLCPCDKCTKAALPSHSLWVEPRRGGRVI